MRLTKAPLQGAYRQLATLALVVEQGSFAGAARELGISRAAVSKRIGELEDDIGVQLLHRTTRTLTLTEVGAAVVDRARRMRAEAEEAFELARETSEVPSGLLRVAAPVGLGQRLVAPVLAGFAARHPKLSAELLLDDSPVDLVAGGIDVAIRGGKLADSSLRARKLGPLSLVVCAAPRHLNLHGEPRVPEDLLEAEWLVLTPMGRPQKVAFEGPEGRATVKLDGRLATNNGEVLRKWVVSGLGIALLPRFWVDDDLAEGRLRRLLPKHTVRGGALYALHPYGRRAPPKVRGFVDALLQVSGVF